MNFLLHRHLADLDLDGPVPGAIAGLGAMLPDLWRMAHRSARARAGVATPRDASPELRALLAGVRHHLRADDVFHRHPVFQDGERRLARRFRDAGIEAPKIGLFAHIGWELCLDGALLHMIGLDTVLQRLRWGRDRAAGHLQAAAIEHVPAVPEAFHGRLDELLDRVARSDWVPGYRHGEGIMHRLGGVRRRVGLPTFTLPDQTRLRPIFDAALDDAGPALETLLADWSRLGPMPAAETW